MAEESVKADEDYWQGIDHKVGPQTLNWVW